MGDSSDDEQIDEYDECPRNTKDLVQKCHSDPGKFRDKNIATARVSRCSNPMSSTTRKCVLTLDGYSYVIGKRQPLFH
jgi:hypothetical protein